MLKLILIGMLFGPGIISSSYAEDTSLKANSVWTGKYLCPQGETDLELKILRVDELGVRAIKKYEGAITNEACGKFSLQKADTQAR